MISVAKTIVENSEQSTIYATNGDISLNAASQVKLRSVDKIVYDKYKAPEQKEKQLKKFLVHVRRPAGYKGEYGFDWLREEYIYPLYYIERDNSGHSLMSMQPLANNVAAVKSTYLNEVTNPVKPYGKDYYPAWLSIFPHTSPQQFKHGSLMHQNGVQLDLELEELEDVINDGTEISFECKNPHLKITPQKINISALMGSGMQNRFLPGRIRVKYYTLKGAINIVNNDAPLQHHEEVKIFAKLGSQKAEVGKLMVYQNNVIPKMELVLVRVGYQGTSMATIEQQHVKDFEYQFKRNSFNQALIRAELKTDTAFEISTLPRTDRDVTNCLDNLQATHRPFNAKQYLDDVIRLYEKYGTHKPPGGKIDADANKRTYMFLTDAAAGALQGYTTGDGNVLDEFSWGNAYMIFLKGLDSRRTLLHEAGHSLGLQHTFSAGDPFSGLAAPPFTFFQGQTDNIMDYSWQMNMNRNPFDRNDKMCSFFKWQWDIMRKDRSLILNY